MDLSQYWWILVVFVGICVFNSINSGGEDKVEKEEDDKKDLGGFLVIFPKQIDFHGARVTVVSGFRYLTQIADQNVGKLWFNLPVAAPIDKVKIRTKGGKEYTYDQQSVPGKLLVDPMPCYNCTLNKDWRK
jgi:hypothetical protein